MIDQTSQFFAILTNIGTAKQANADALGVAWKITQMGVGDANGTDPIPSAAQTALINERRRAPLNQLKVDPNNSAIIVAEQVIPEDVGGWWIREIGLYDADGDLVAIANCAPSFKPLLAQGSGRTQVVRMNMIVSNSSNVELRIDPSVVLATRSYVDAKVLEELNKLDSKQSVLVATTANIALAGLQTIDGVAVPAGARVLVKNQTVPKDNGIYLAAAAVWTRAPDADTNAEVTSALLTSVEQGATQADTRWQLITDGLIVVGTTALTFQNVTQGFAPINSPALITPTATSTPPQFDNSLLLATAGFVRRQGFQFSSFLSLSANTTLSLAEVGGLVSFSSASMLVCTLPPTNTIPAIATATISVICAGNGGLTISPSVGDTVNTSTGVVGSIVLALGETAEFVRLNGQWRLFGGTAALRYAVTTPPLFDDSDTLATTKFVRRAGGNYRGFTSLVATTTLTTGAVGTLVTVIGAFPLTLPAANAVPSGGAIHFRNIGNAVVTVVCAGADAINAGNGNQPTSILLQPGATLELSSNGVNAWWAAGSAQLQYAKVFGYTPDQFDNSDLLATAKHVQRALGSLSGVADIGNGASAIASHVGKNLNIGAGGSNLPPTASVPDGATLNYKNTGVGSHTLTRVGADIISCDGSNLTSIVVGTGEDLKLVRVGNNWIGSGSAALKYGAGFQASLLANGWQKLPSGKIEQWGATVAIPAGGSVVVTLPFAMPVNILAVEVTAQSSTNDTTPISGAWNAINNGTFTLRNKSTVASIFSWSAIGW